MVNHGLVEEDGNTYQITDRGKILVADLFSVLKSGQIAEDNDELVLFLTQIPDWENWIPSLTYLEKSQIYVQDEAYSNPPYNKYVDLLTKASHICELVHRTIIYSDELDEEFATTDMTGQFIGNPNIAGDSEIDEHRFRGWREKYENGAEYRVLKEREIRFTLSLFDFDDDGKFEGVGIFPSESDEKDVFLYSESDEFIEWGEDMFNQLWIEAGGVCPMDPAVVYD